MLPLIIYVVRVILMFITVWLGVRIIGKKSIAEITSYDLVAIMLFTTVAAEPLVYKVTSKATVGVIVVVGLAVLVGRLSLRKSFYNFDTDPLILVANGKINMKNLKIGRMNIPLLLSELRVKGFQNVSDMQLVVLEPTGKVSAIPKPANRPIQPSDMNITKGTEGLALPFIIDGQIQKTNLDYANLDMTWLEMKLDDLGYQAHDILILEMNSQGQITYQLKDAKVTSQDIFQQMN